MHIAIRHAEPGDYDQIITKVDSWWGGRQMAVMLPRLFFSHFRPWTYIAVQDDAIVGFLAGLRSQTDPSQVYCHFIGVDPRFRGQGIGQALYQRLFSEAAIQGCDEILAVTSPENRGSVAFHTGLGFQPLAGTNGEDSVPFTTDYDGPGEDRVRFRKPLGHQLVQSQSLDD